MTEYDLEERAAVWGEAAIELALVLPANPVASPLITQFVKSSTSIGANYCEAHEAESKLDFRHKIAVCPKESNETKSWGRMPSKACPEPRKALRQLWSESKQLTLIFFQNHPPHRCESKASKTPSIIKSMGALAPKIPRPALSSLDINHLSLNISVKPC